MAASVAASIEPTWVTLVTWVLVFAGWFAVHHATLARDRRKEKREAAANLCDDLLELQAAAIDFHTASHCDIRKSTDLAQEVERIVLQLTKKPFSELDIPLSRRVVLRQRITRRNADPSDFVSQPANSQIVLEIRNAVTDLIFAIEEARESNWK